jgi:hypothetical protein
MACRFLVTFNFGLFKKKIAFDAFRRTAICCNVQRWMSSSRSCCTIQVRWVRISHQTIRISELWVLCWLNDALIGIQRLPRSVVLTCTWSLPACYRVMMLLLMRGVVLVVQYSQYYFTLAVSWCAVRSFAVGDGTVGSATCAYLESLFVTSLIISWGQFKGSASCYQQWGGSQLLTGMGMREFTYMCPDRLSKG